MSSWRANRTPLCSPEPALAIFTNRQISLFSILYANSPQKPRFPGQASHSPSALSFMIPAPNESIPYQPFTRRRPDSFDAAMLPIKLGGEPVPRNLTPRRRQNLVTHRQEKPRSMPHIISSPSCNRKQTRSLLDDIFELDTRRQTAPPAGQPAKTGRRIFGENPARCVSHFATTSATDRKKGVYRAVNNNFTYPPKMRHPSPGHPAVRDIILSLDTPVAHARSDFTSAQAAARSPFPAPGALT